MNTYIAVSIGGALGCLIRYAVTNLFQEIYGHNFPIATLMINLLGSFLMGFFFVEMLEKSTISPQLRVGIIAGFLGGFTTFSTFAMEALLLAEQNEIINSVVYVFLSVFFGLIAVFSGAFLARNL